MELSLRQKESMKGKQIVCGRAGGQTNASGSRKDNRKIMCDKGKGKGIRGTPTQLDSTRLDKQTEGKWQKDKPTQTSSHRQ